MMSNVIDVSIYGGKDYLLGGRETKRRALIGSCRYADTCAALKEGRCSVAEHHWQKCKYLNASWVEGYTSRAKKFDEFMDKWRGHEKYNNVKKSLKRFEYVGSNMIRIELPHMDIERAAKGESGYEAFDSNNVGYIKRDEFDVDVLINIMESYSLPVFGGGKLTAKKEKEEMLIAIKEIDHELYDEYVEKTGKVIDYVGMTAFVTTLKANIDLGKGWYWDGEYVRKEEIERVDCDILPYSSYSKNISFIPESDTTIEVKDNDWVTDDTKFR